MEEYREFKTVMLILTENCNLNCIYCYEHNKTTKDMEFEVAKQIIDREFKDLHLYEHGEIELFGGEPFINFELIRNIYDYVMDKYGKDNDIVFATTTNGTLVHGEIQKWLYDRRKNFICTLSLDGTPQSHNRNRPFRGGQGSYEKIDLDFFLNTWEHCGAKMTISNASLCDFADGVIHIESLGFECLATFASGMDWSAPDTRDVLFEQMGKLVEYYCRHPEKKVCQMLNMDLRLMFYPLDDTFRYCGAGLRKRCYDIQGNWYPCQGLSPLTVGADAVNFREKDFNNFTLSDATVCKKCKWVRLCRTCYAANFLETGCIEKNCPQMCLLNRVCMMAASRIQFERLIPKSEFSNDDRLVLKAIEEIQATVLDDPMA